MKEILASPEFWSSFAFILVILVFMRPLIKGLNGWTEKQVSAIHREQTSAREVLEKAEEIKKKYEKAYLNRFSEKQKMMQEADSEIAFLDEETHILTMDRINHKKQEVELRLKMIEENGRQDVKSKMLNQVLSDTRRRLKERDEPEDPEKVLQTALNVLDEKGKAFF